MVVIAIIGTLASVVLASLNTAREKARDAHRISSVKELVKAIEIYYLDNNNYPPSGGPAELGSTCPWGSCIDRLNNDLVPRYFSSLPRDVLFAGTNNDFLYGAPGGVGYRILIRLETDGISGTCIAAEKNWTGSGWGGPWNTSPVCAY